MAAATRQAGINQGKTTGFSSALVLVFRNERPKITLLGTNISPNKALLKMIFLCPRWGMLVPRGPNSHYRAIGNLRLHHSPSHLTREGRSTSYEKITMSEVGVDRKCERPLTYISLYFYIYFWVNYSEQSAEVTPNDNLVRESTQKCPDHSGLGIIVIIFPYIYNIDALEVQRPLKTKDR